MKKLISAAVVVATMMTCAASVQAADRKVMLPISGAMNANDAQSRLGDSVKFYFGKQPGPVVLEKLASDKTSQKTNAFGKSDEKACNWVFLSAMLQLQKRAKELGANAVVNIASNYDNVEYSSEAEFECHAGGIMAGVALKGDFVRIGNK
ncbi:MAG: excinuclease ATPase subunit [Burkholderiales bacterium]|nr:excinuclease ATPase subunit [Burkholderiales bacterium]